MGCEFQFLKAFFIAKNCSVFGCILLQISDNTVFLFFGTTESEMDTDYEVYEAVGKICVELRSFMTFNT
jgi:hypothetical protein